MPFPTILGIESQSPAIETRGLEAERLNKRAPARGHLP